MLSIIQGASNLKQVSGSNSFTVPPTAAEYNFQKHEQINQSLVPSIFSSIAKDSTQENILEPLWLLWSFNFVVIQI